ncbi:MAG: hypothetical protein ACR2G2_16345 [Pseudonocardia sp.]
MTSDQGSGRHEPGDVTSPEPLSGLPSGASAKPPAAGADSTAEPSAYGDRPEQVDDAEPAREVGEGEQPSRPMGRMSYQDENTAPREPTLAEQRAHQQAERKAVEDEQARLAEEARKKKIRKRVLIGGGAAAGVAALIAIGYASSSDGQEVAAKCVDEQTNQVVDDGNCVQPAANSSYDNGGHYGGGFYPIFLGGFGRQYHYNYGGGGGIGQTATGGTTTVPKDATVRSSSGRVIQRGGFGVSKAGGSSTGGRSGGGFGGSGGSGAGS